jgi:exopolysaccharide biosynthesis polyprenyl glycosylphosphotransferase
MDSKSIGYTDSWAASSTVSEDAAQGLGAGLTPSERRYLLAIVDLLLINGALLLSLILFQDFSFSFVALLLNVKWFLTLSALWVIVGMVLDIYNLARAASTVYGAIGAGAAGLLTSLAYQAIPWLTPRPGRRVFVFAFAGLALASVALWRAIYALVLVQPSFRRQVLVVGKGCTAHRLAAELDRAAETEQANPFRGTGYDVVGFVDQLPVKQGTSLDPPHSLVRLIRKEGVDEVLVAQDLSPAFHEAILDCRELGLSVAPLIDAYTRLTRRLPVEHASRDLSFIMIGKDDPSERLFWAAKRGVDLIFGLLGLGATLALMPFAALGNALTSPGPLFYHQQRVGRGGEPFRMIKFRTMTPDAEDDGAVWAADDDPRVTPVGRLLRISRLDELPQCINILRGEMSLIGPRPERPQFVGEISHTLPIYRARHAVRPGITGWAQIRYRYGNSLEDARVKLEYDLYYIKNAGFWLDLVIFLQTIPVMLSFKGQ